MVPDVPGTSSIQVKMGAAQSREFTIDSEMFLGVHKNGYEE
jgi:hypothetical protein